MAPGSGWCPGRGTGGALGAGLDLENLLPTSPSVWIVATESSRTQRVQVFADPQPDAELAPTGRTASGSLDLAGVHAGDAHLGAVLQAGDCANSA